MTDQTEPEDTCRPVEIDGELIRVHGAAEMSDESRAALAEVISAAKRKYGSEHPAEHLTADRITDDQLDALYAERNRLRAAILDIDAHATPIGLANPDDPEGNPHHYAVTVGALHRALGKIGHTAAPCRAEADLERVRQLHQPMQRGPFTICAHCSGWDGKWRCLGVVTDYPCPTIRALGEPTPAATKATDTAT